MAEFSEHDEYVDPIATQYDQVGQHYVAARDGAERAGDVHPAGSYIDEHCVRPKLADIGCGGGQDLQTYMARGFDVVGVDPSQTMVRLARERLGPEADIRHGLWRALPFPDASLDYVVGRSSLHYEPDISKAYREAARVLKASGTLIAIIAHPYKAAHRELVAEGGRIYVKDKIFSGQVDITYPWHTLDEYFSPLFHELFDLQDQTEVNRQRLTGSEPGQIQFTAYKRAALLDA